MSGDDSGMFFEKVAALARHVPSEAASQAALEAARDAIVRSHAARKERRRFWMRMTIPSGIAAAVIGAAVLVTMPGVPRASAADQFEQALQATKAYKGWVHWTQVPQAEAAFQAKHGKDIPTRMTRHFNVESGTTALVLEFADDLSIDMQWKSKREMATYDRKEGTIVLATMDTAQAEAIDKMPMPVTMSEMVSQITEKLGRKPASVKETPEGELVRFDITLFATDGEWEAFQKNRGGQEPIPMGFTIWVNKEKLITRLHKDAMKGEAKALGPTDIQMTYGNPEIKDVYDLGAPRDAKVIDRRIGDEGKGGNTSGMSKLATRLQERRAKGFGDGVALLSSYMVDSTGQNMETRSGNVTLFVTQGDKWLANQYVLFAPGNFAGGKGVLAAKPEGWPALDAEKLVPALRKATPQIYWILNGDQGWYGSLDRTVLSMKPATAANRELFRMQGLNQQLWPDLSKLPGEVMMQNGLLRVRGKMQTTLRDGGAGDLEWTYLLDLAKDDLPREHYQNTMKKEAGELADRGATHYLNYAQLPNGQWYPTDWTEEHVQRNPANGNDNGYVQKFHLQIVPGMKVDEGWFADPRGYVEGGGK